MSKMRYDAPSLDRLNDHNWHPFLADGPPMKLPPNFDASALGSVPTCAVQMAIKLRKIYDSL